MGGKHGQFRYKNRIPLSYDRQGYIFFYCKRYAQLTVEQQQQIINCCAAAGGVYKDAVFRYMTSSSGAEKVCKQFYVGQSTLERCVRKFYLRMNETIS